MITADSLNAQKSKDLAQMAKKNGIPGWHSMRKAQLIRALLKLAKDKEKSKSGKPKSISSNGSAHSRRNSKPNSQPVPSAIARKLAADREELENRKNLALIAASSRNHEAPESDRLVAVVRDAFWVQAYWEITKSTVQRTKVALTRDWHRAKPVLRLLKITSDGNTNSVEEVVEEIEIHGGVKNWFIHVREPAKAYRIAIGYCASHDRFHLICKSNEFTLPQSPANAIDENWTDLTNDAEKYYALSGGYNSDLVNGELQSIFEEKSRQPMVAPAFERLGSGINGHTREFEFQVDAHMIIHGCTNPNGSVTIAGDPVRIEEDGAFSLKVDLPERRQVLPVVAASRDGTQQRTTVIAIERNTKVMEPVSNEFG